ncbi:MAG: hypothetical protein ACI81L_000910 [Verrucomicrobiales bacterium]|jgi:hypothetical protein
MRARCLALILFAVVVSACGRGESIVEPGPGDTDEATTTTQPSSDDDQGELRTDDAQTVSSASTTLPPGNGDQTGGASPTTFIVDENSENAAAYTELASSGLVLTLDEQSCADATATSSTEAGSDDVDAVIDAVQECASPKAIDDFAAGLIIAGGSRLPATEAACVSSKLQSTSEYRPFWVALLDEEPFDFLLSDLEVQNRYLDLYAECVSVGRAVGEQSNIELSPPTIGCIDDLYTDREFVRVTIEADLSGNEDDRARIDSQLAGCLTADERSALANG